MQQSVIFSLVIELTQFSAIIIFNQRLLRAEKTVFGGCADMEYLDNIRTTEKTSSTKTRMIAATVFFLLGICLGTFSKYLDYRQAELPAVMQAIDQALDLHNFLGGLSPWILIAVCISVYSCTAVIAAVDVFLFFSGMVASYYIYSNYVAGFFPKSYAMIWIGLTIVSPILAFICWYAKGKGLIALLLSAGIISVLMNTAFAYGVFYIGIRSWLNAVMMILGIMILMRSLKETIMMIGMGAVLAILLKIILKF